MLDTGAGNTTKATGGAAMTANAKRVHTLTTVVGGTELDVVKGDVLVFTITKTASATTMDQCSLTTDFSFTN